MSSGPIVLDLAHGASSPGTDTRAVLQGVIEDLVALLEAQFPSSPEFPADALRMRLLQSRERLRASEDTPEASGAGRRLIGDASQAYARLSGHSSAREAEFTGVIHLLRELVDGLRGDAVAFRDDLIKSSARVADLTQLEDIRTLRRALNKEVDQLRQCVQQGERREAARLSKVAGDLRRVDETLAQGAETREGPTVLLGRPVLLRDLAAEPHVPACIVLCRIDEAQAIAEAHGASVLERVVIALAQLLKGAFGTDIKLYRSDTQCVAMLLPRTSARQLAPQVRKVQARVAPEYEYERHGVTRRVVFTFSSVIVHSAGRTPGDGVDALERAETQAERMQGLSQLQTESSALGRLVGWFSGAG